MFRISGSIMASNLLFYLFFAGLLTAVSAAQDFGWIRLSSGMWLTVAWLYLAMLVHRTALFGVSFNLKDQNGASPQLPFLRFVVKGVLLSLMPLPLFLLGMFLIMPQMSMVSDNLALLPVLAILGIAVPVYGLALGLAGTWLPATIYGQNQGFLAALSRARSTFWPIFAWSVVAMLLSAGGSFALMIGADRFDLSDAVAVNGHFSPVGAGLTFGMMLLQAFGATLIAVVLSGQYMKSEGIVPPT